ncbi:MAG: hypothetical protein DRH15_03460, partial [Deltaproteobacteria bacterium]
NGNIIQGLRRGGIFAQRVDIHAGEYNVGDFQLWVNSDKEVSFAPDTFRFDIFVKNSTDSVFEGKIIVDQNHTIIDSIMDVTVPPESVVTYNYSKMVNEPSRFMFGLYLNDHYNYSSSWLEDAIVKGEKGVNIRSNPFKILINNDKPEYILGRDTIVNLTTVINKSRHQWDLVINRYFYNESLYFLGTDTIKLGGKDTTIFADTIFTDENDYLGDSIYSKAEIFTLEGDRVSDCTKRINLLYPPVQCSLSVPDSFDYLGDNYFTAYIIREWSYIPPGVLKVTGKDYADSVVIDTFLFVQETSFVFNFRPSQWHREDYIKAVYTYREQKAVFTKKLLFGGPNFSFLYPYGCMRNDQYLYSYTNVNFPLKTWWSYYRERLYNAPYVLTLELCHPGGDTFKDTIFPEPGKREYFNLMAYIDTIIVPESTIYSYKWQLHFLDYNTDQIISTGYRVGNPRIHLIPQSNDTFNTGEYLPIYLDNPHFESVHVAIDSIRFIGSDIERTYTGFQDVTLPIDTFVQACSLEVPAWVSGRYHVIPYVHPIEYGWKTGHKVSIGYPIYLDGISTMLNVASEKEWFLPEDIKVFTSQLQNGNVEYGGEEKIKVCPMMMGEDTMGLGFFDDSLPICLGMHFDGENFVIDPDYSLCVIAEYNLPDPWGKIRRVKAQGGLPVKDDNGGFWAIETYLKKVMHYSHNFSLLPDTFTMDISGNIKDACYSNGWIFVIDTDGIIYKINSLDGSVSFSWESGIEMPGGITVDGGRIIVLDNSDGTLNGFTEFGDHVGVDTVIPGEYIDLACYGGEFYLLAERDVITYKGGEIDSFPLPENSMEGFAICTGDTGELAITWADIYERTFLSLYNRNGEEVARGLVFRSFDGRPCFDGNDVVVFNHDLTSASVCRVFGKERGMVLWRMGEMLPDSEVYTFIDYDSLCEYGGGYIKVYGTYSNIRERVNPLSEFRGTHRMPDVAVEVHGNSSYPLLKNIILEMAYAEEDSAVAEWNHAFNLSWHASESFIDTLYDTIPGGEYAVIGRVWTDTGQYVVRDVDFFTVVDSGIGLIVRSDTNDVEPGYMFQSITKIINTTPENQAVHLRLFTEDSLYRDTTLQVDSMGVDTILTEIQVWTPLMLTGEVVWGQGDTVENQVLLNVVRGLFNIDIYAPDYAGLSPFIVKSRIKNASDRERNVVVMRRCGLWEATDTLDLEGWESFEIYDTVSIGKEEYFVVNAGNVKDSVKIKYGIAEEMIFDSLYVLPNDSVSIPGLIKNTGVYPGEFKILGCLYRESIGKGLFRERYVWMKKRGLSSFIQYLVKQGVDTSLVYTMLNPGIQDTIVFKFNTHEADMYGLDVLVFVDTTDILIDSLSTDVNLINTGSVSVEDIFVQPLCDTNGDIHANVVIENSEHAGFSGILRLSSDFFYEEKEVEVEKNSIDTVEFLMDGGIDEGVHRITASLINKGRVISQLMKEQEFKPVYVIDSLSGPIHSSPEGIVVPFALIRNTGNGEGERVLKMEWADVVNLENYINIPIGRDTFFIDSFPVPEDMPGGIYYCRLSVLNDGFPEVDTFIPV